MKSYSERFNIIMKKLMEACDDRLLKLDADGWDERVVPVAEVPEGELQETALWLAQGGYHSVEEMIGNMLWALQEEVGVDIVIAADTDNFRIGCVKNSDGYYVPYIDIVANIVESGEYWCGNSPLTTEYSEKCWKALSDEERNHLESLDWDDLEYEDQMNICTYGRYDVDIEIGFDGKVTLFHYDGE